MIIRLTEVVGQQGKAAQVHAQRAQPKPLEVDSSRVKMAQCVSRRRLQSLNQPRHLLGQIRV